MLEAVEYCTDADAVLVLRVIVNAKFLVPEFPSVRVTSLMVMLDVVESSLVMVPNP